MTNFIKRQVSAVRVSVYLLFGKAEKMKNFIKHIKPDLVFAVLFFVMAIMDVVSKDYQTALLNFIITVSSFEAYKLKKQIKKYESEEMKNV